MCTDVILSPHQGSTLTAVPWVEKENHHVTALTLRHQAVSPCSTCPKGAKAACFSHAEIPMAPSPQCWASAQGTRHLPC